MNIQEDNHSMLAAIYKAKIKYTVRKYAGAWVPVVINGGKRTSFAHCATSGDAMHIAISKAYKQALLIEGANQ